MQKTLAGIDVAMKRLEVRLESSEQEALDVSNDRRGHQEPRQWVAHAGD